MKKGTVIYINNPHPSHSWSNGLYLVRSVNKKMQQMSISLINKDGTIQTSKSITGTNKNPNVTITKLIFLSK